MKSIECVSDFIRSQQRNMISQLYIQFTDDAKLPPALPVNPINLFTEEELSSMTNMKQRIFCSYFTSADVPLDAVFDFEPTTDLDYLLVGIYCIKNGVDKQMSELIRRRPELFVFTLRDFFIALYAPHLEQSGHQSIKINVDEPNYPFVVYVDGEPRDCLELARELHHSPHLRTLTYHIGENSKAFQTYLEK